MSKLDKTVKLYLLECINTDDEKANTFNDRIMYVREKFYKEKAQDIQRYGPPKAMTEWLGGLATNVDYIDCDILALAVKWDMIPERYTELQASGIVETWFSFLANKMLQLLNDYRVPFDIEAQPKELIISSFNYSHDVNGNPTAHYSVNNRQVTKQRIQTGYDNANHENGCFTAIEKAGCEPYCYIMTSIEGDRSQGEASSVWVRP